MNTIDTIIFDLGGVLYDIDVDHTARAFTEMGAGEINMEALHKSMHEEHIYEGLDTGRLSPAGFRDEIRRLTGMPLSDEQVDAAWNALLVEFPARRVKMMLSLRKNYRLLLLSNTNAIHFDYYSKHFETDYGIPFESLFDKAYYSFRIGLCKPDPGIYRHVITDSKLEPEKAVFIDDLFVNVEAARKTGLKAIHLNGIPDVTDLFRDNRLDTRFLKS
ncbi:MAG TPA: HAD family phosphatase [Bacteroidales bacterium]|nr:HAD family phosphatase [Bacteroidales bacterium]